MALSKSSTTVLNLLREAMKTASSKAVQAYIIPTEDPHQSEYVAECHKRRQFISGFTGSAGTAVVTLSKAALWTDGRYFAQAPRELDENWTLMKSGLQGTPTICEWLIAELKREDSVGIDPYLISVKNYDNYVEQFSKSGIKLAAIKQNLVDLVWKGRPGEPNQPVFPLELKFTGNKWKDKIELIRNDMSSNHCQAMVLTALDDIAWVLNLRGSDIEYNPVFFSYLIITAKKIYFMIEDKRFTPEVSQHLELKWPLITILPYSGVEQMLQEIASMDTVEKVWLSESSSIAMYNCIPKDKLFLEALCVPRMKAIKNPIEIACMKSCHIRDGLALCEYQCWLEEMVTVKKEKVTEISGSDQLEEFRKQQSDYVSLSFATISGSGPNGAIIHYKSKPETDRDITDKELYLVDSGAQYRDGTTDVTRTIHLGEPTQEERTNFTLVLKGHINLARAVFPEGTKGERLDTFARQALWENGLDYRHGTGHGVGMFLNVHEGPCGIGTRPTPNGGLAPGMILSDEPGFYIDGKYGIRIESLMLVVVKNTTHNFGNISYLTFEPITFAPIQTKLIEKSLLTAEEVAWINDYHKLCVEKVGQLMLEKGNYELHAWLTRECKEI